MKRWFEIAFLLFMTLPAAAQPASLVVSDGWFRSLPGKLPAAGYFNVRSNSSTAVAITGAEAQGCAALMLHQSTDTGGMSRMAMVGSVVVPPGGTVKFAPGGYHLMCTSPTLKIGGRVPVTLHLSNGGSIVTAFQVRGATGK